MTKTSRSIKFLIVFEMIVEYFSLFLCWTASSVHSEAVKSPLHRTNSIINEEIREFKELIRRGHPFIDKTLFIKDILEHPSTSTLILCPRKWGKTITLDTLKTFLEIETDAEGNVLANNVATNYKLFRNGEIVLENGQVKKLTQPLLITEHKELLDQHQGKYPVISLDFNDTVGENCDAIQNRMKVAIARAFNQHKYITKVLQRPSATEQQKNQLITFQKYLNPANVSERDIIESIEFLCKILHEHFNKTAYVLFENYDMPLHSVLHFKNFPKEDIKPSLVLIEELMGYSFTFNDHLDQAIITGTFHLDQPGYQPRWNQYCFYGYADSPDPMLQHFGFKHADVEKLLRQYNLTASLSKVKQFYGGYKMSAHSVASHYNPYSVLNFLHDKKISFHVSSRVNIDFLVKLLVHSALLRVEIFKLVNRKPVQIDDVWLDFKEETIIFLKDLLHEEHIDKMESNVVDIQNGIKDLTSQAISIVCAYLLSTGFLSPDEHVSAGSKAEAQLPNYENAHELTEKLITAFLKKYNIEEQKLITAATHLKQFVIDQNTTSRDAELSLQVLYQHLPPFDVLLKSTLTNDVFGIENPVYRTLSYVLLEIQYLSNFTMGVALRGLFPDIVVHGEDSIHATAIRITFNQKATDAALQSALFQKSKFNDAREVVTTKYIGINVHVNKTVQMVGIYNNTNNA